MRATAFEFRIRWIILVVVFVLGFWSPWVGAGARISLLEWLSLELSRAGIVAFSVATPLVIAVAILFALAGAVLRVWGTAALGPGVMRSHAMQGDALMAAGPYRYVRNPLYLGLTCMTIAMAFAMPPTGALFTVVLVMVFEVRLIAGEEAFLESQLGEPYLIYRSMTPRVMPRLRTNLPRVAYVPQWGRAVLAEINPIGIFVIFATLSWRYNNALLMKAILICFGVSLIARGVAEN